MYYTDPNTGTRFFLRVDLRGGKSRLYVAVRDRDGAIVETPDAPEDCRGSHEAFVAFCAAISARRFGERAALWDTEGRLKVGSLRPALLPTAR